MIAAPTTHIATHSHSNAVDRVDDRTRLFQPFFDPIDGILFVSATATASDVESQIGEHRLRFPLFLDRKASLSDQLMSSSHAPASSRFGPFCDHVVGMNWRLPDGQVVRLGERVAKTTTGYDVFRFFLNAGRRFGFPQDLVLRLRPRTDITMVTRFEGQADQIRASAEELLQTCWLHWFDAIDLVADESSLQLRIQTHCPSPEWSVFESRLQKLANAHALSLQSTEIEHLLTDGLPDVVLKTTPDQVARIAAAIERKYGARCIGMCYPAVIHVYANAGQEVSRLCQEVRAEYGPLLHPLGGDLQSRHLPTSSPEGVESSWISTFLQEAGIQ